MSVLDEALALAEVGFHVFPLEPGTKVPAISEFPTRATRSPKQIEAWFTCPVTGAPLPRNIGISTSRFGDSKALLVVDIDVKRGVNGEASAKSLDLPETWESSTPSGGRHLIYLADEAVSQGAHSLAPGVDTRSQGGYIVAPGSTLPEGKYAWTRPPTALPVAKAPPSILSKPQKPSTPAAGIVAPSSAEARATEYLLSRAPIAIEGAGGDQTTYTVAAKLRDYGTAEHDALDLMLDLWNPRCEPPWPPSDLATKVRNAYTYAQNSEGNLAPELDFPPERSLGRLHYEPWGSAIQFSPLPYLIKGVLDQGTMSVLYGEPGAGKSFVCLDLAIHIAQGADWRGHRTTQGAVLYVAAEGAGSMRKRLLAYKIKHGTASIPLALVPCPVDLFSNTADTKGLTSMCALVEAEMGQPVRLVVIDTLARAMGSGNENAAEDMGTLIRHVDSIRIQTGAHTMLVHHSGKDSAKGARGHSSLRGATDTELEIDCQKNLTVRKQRDIDSAGRWGFDLESIRIGTDTDGDPITSAVVVARDADALTWEAANKRITGKNQKLALECIQAVLAEEGGPSEFCELERCDIEAVWEQRAASDKGEKYLKQSLERALQGLATADVIMIHETTGAVAPLWS